jgi:serine/threonine protein phosphatase PrpC
MRFSVYQVSRKGGREKNEDRMGYCYTRDAGLFALADGMGGHPEGEVASQLALQTLAAMFQRDCKPTLPDPLRFLHEAIVAGHHQLLRYATQKALIDTPRTTIVACLMQGNAAYWAHCGDSRLYMVRGDKLIARTRDHSYSELQQTMSQVVPMGDRFNRNVLFTCLGSPGKPVVDTVGPLLMQAGDRLLLCSDGLWGTGERQRDHRSAVGAAALRLGARAGRAGAAQRRPEVRQRLGPGDGVGRRRERQPLGHPDDVARRGGVRVDDPGERARHRRVAGRARRRRDRALDKRNQRSDKALLPAQERLNAFLALLERFLASLRLKGEAC